MPIFANPNPTITPGRHCSSSWHNECNKVVNANFKGTNEPDIVHELFFNTVSGAVGRWQASFTAWTPTISYGGVFTHQTPKVTFVSKNKKHNVTCELADLLMVCTNHHSSTRRAILYQAKMTTSKGGWPPQSPDQWELLTTWPSIQFNANGRSHSLTMPFVSNPDEGAQYLLLGKTGKTVEPAQARTPKTPMPLADHIYDLLNSSTGRDLSWSAAKAKDDWDDLVWTLITSMNRAVANIGVKTNVPREVGSFFQVLPAGLTVSPRKTIVTIPQSDASVPEWGIPIIHIVVGKPKV